MVNLETSVKTKEQMGKASCSSNGKTLHSKANEFYISQRLRPSSLQLYQL